MRLHKILYTLKEFDNQLIDQVFNGFGIEKSLSRAGGPYDNAVAETTFKSFKTEFIDQEVFESLEKLKVMSLDYIHWWNYQRIHGSLDYQPPMVVRLRSDEKEFINLSK
ncbi:transposase [Streptococcus danieliae]|uniref:Transposase n=1 Tax=Streptococcus danieliae TaxID=747656 RepID=A0A7Z0M8P4_9STRE|nr:transposase [Streptococcus danieliae]NYS97437.1 transposase [Streptococcus danieliae]